MTAIRSMIADRLNKALADGKTEVSAALRELLEAVDQHISRIERAKEAERQKNERILANAYP